MHVHQIIQSYNVTKQSHSEDWENIYYAYHLCLETLLLCCWCCGPTTAPTATAKLLKSTSNETDKVSLEEENGEPQLAPILVNDDTKEDKSRKGDKNSKSGKHRKKCKKKGGRATNL